MLFCMDISGTCLGNMILILSHIDCVVSPLELIDLIGLLAEYNQTEMMWQPNPAAPPGTVWHVKW